VNSMKTLEQLKERKRREAERKRVYGKQSKAINNAYKIVRSK